MRTLLVVLCLGWLPLAAAGQSALDDAALEALARRVASELRCPRCQGLSIADSPDDLAVQMNAVVREQLREGRSPEEVRAYFVSRYGEWVLLKPDPRGFNLVVYLVPILVMIAGAGLLGMQVRRWTGGARSAGSSIPPASQQE
jgi:cytochrome c-type biogenesis protein CcmH